MGNKTQKMIITVCWLKRLGIHKRCRILQELTAIDKGEENGRGEEDREKAEYCSVKYPVMRRARFFSSPFSFSFCFSSASVRSIEVDTGLISTITNKKMTVDVVERKEAT